MNTAKKQIDGFNRKIFGGGKKRRRTAALFLGALLLSGSGSRTVSANSAQTYWEGVSAGGVVVTEGECPIEIERELLTFDIPEFPADYYRDADEFLAYRSSVTAEYAFYNPADYTVTARLLFPLGNEPAEYARLWDEEEKNLVCGADTEKFDITVNGEPIEKKLRYSLSLGDSQFELERELALLCDGYADDPFYSPELTVTKYVFRIEGLDTERYRAACAAFDVPEGSGSTKIYLQNQSGMSTQKDGEKRISIWVDGSGLSAVVYAIGEPFADLPEWRFYEDGGVEDGEEIGGTMVLESAETLTFQEFALAGWEERSGISGTDWYNAVVAELREEYGLGDYEIVLLRRYESGLAGHLLRWYEYEITLGPGERIVNAVTAPIYPSINKRSVSASPEYGYTYLLSPAKTWAGFGELEIVVNTPYYLIDTGIEGVARSENGYAAKLGGLPDGELEFTLCASEKPASGSFGIGGAAVPAAAGAVLLLLGGTAAILLIRRRKGRNGRT